MRLLKKDWTLRFYLSAHSDFGFFSCVGYLHPKLHIKGVKSPFLNFVGYMKHRLLLEGLLRYYTVPPWELMKFKIPEIKPSHEAWVCLIDYKNILHESHENRK